MTRKTAGNIVQSIGVFALLAAYSFPAFAAATAVTAPASVQGTLLAHDGTPIRGAKITANLTSPPPTITAAGSHGHRPSTRFSGNRL